MPTFTRTASRRRSERIAENRHAFADDLNYASRRAAVELELRANARAARAAGRVPRSALDDVSLTGAFVARAKRRAAEAERARREAEEKQAAHFAAKRAEAEAWRAAAIRELEAEGRTFEAWKAEDDRREAEELADLRLHAWAGERAEEACGGWRGLPFSSGDAAFIFFGANGPKVEIVRCVEPEPAVVPRVQEPAIAMVPAEDILELERIAMARVVEIARAAKRPAPRAAAVRTRKVAERRLAAKTARRKPPKKASRKARKPRRKR